MRLTLILLLACISVLPAAESVHQEVRHRLYFGLPGSRDYVAGNPPGSSPVDAWFLHSEMPVALMDHCAAVTDSYVYVASGYNASHPRLLIRHRTGSSQWTSLARPPLALANGGCAALGDTLYYCSGYSYELQATVDTLLKYSVSDDDWSSGPGPFDETTYNWQPLVVACAGKLYRIGGCEHPGVAAPTRQVWCYTPGSGWLRVADMNQGRVFASAWTWHDTIWVTGGMADEVALDHTEFYDPIADVWSSDSSIFPPLPYPVWGAASGVVGSTGFVASGVVGGSLVDSVAYFHHDSRRWSISGPLLEPVYRGAGAGSPDGRAIIYGGSIGGFYPIDTCQFELVETGAGHDVGVDRMLTPEAVVAPGDLVPRAVVRNFGMSSEQDLIVSCGIDSGDAVSVYFQSVLTSGELIPGDTVVAEFPTWSATEGVYRVTAFTELGTDEQPWNDTLRTQTTVVQQTLEWSEVDTLRPHRLGRTSCCAYDATDGWEIHVICGNCEEHVSHPYDEIYDTHTGTWRTGLEHPGGGGLGVHNHDAVLLGDVIWCGGGSRGEQGFYSWLTRLDIAAGIWTEVAEMPLPDLIYYELCAYPDSGWIYLFGGSPGGGPPVHLCFRFDSETGQWDSITPMPEPRRDPMAVYVPPDTVCVIGGSSGPDMEDTRGTVWKYSVSGNRWIAAIDTMPDNLAWGGGVSYESGFGQHVYIVAGCRRGTVTNTCWRYDAASGGWEEEPGLPNDSRSHGTAIAGDAIWVTGGYNDVSGQLGQVVRGDITPVGVAEGPAGLSWRPSRRSGSVARGELTLGYSLLCPAEVRLDVYDVQGRLIRRLVDQKRSAGTWLQSWNGRDRSGQLVPEGTYFFHLSIDGIGTSAKVLLLH